MKIKESGKTDKYLNLSKELKTLWNMKLTMIPIVVGALGTVPKGLEKKTLGIGNQRKNQNNPDHSIGKIS